MAYTARFKFIGGIVIPKEQERFIKKWKGGAKGNTEMRRINFGVKESDSNMCFVELFDMKRDTIYTMNRDNERIEIPWGDRNTDDSLRMVADYRKYVVDLGSDFGGRKEFISGYDFIEYLEEMLPKYERKVTVNGKYLRRHYNGKFYDTYEIDSVYASTAAINSLTVRMDLYYNKESVDNSEFKSDKKIYLDTYIKQYVDKDTGDKFFSRPVVLNASRFTDSDEHQKYLKNILKYVVIKNKEIIHIPWKCKVVNGAETVEFDESMLSDAQREQIECGVATIDDFKTGEIYGPSINEIRLIMPILKGDFKDGFVSADLSASEFEEEIFQPPKAESMKEVMETVEEENDNENDDFDNMLEELMG